MIGSVLHTYYYLGCPKYRTLSPRFLKEDSAMFGDFCVADISTTPPAPHLQKSHNSNLRKFTIVHYYKL